MITQHFGGSWRRACRSLWGLQADGRYTGASRPWDNVIRGRPRVRYSEQECLDALRRCAQRFNRVPTTSLYIRWARLEKSRARESGAPIPRLPDYESYRRRYGGRARALAAAAPLFHTANRRGVQPPRREHDEMALGSPVLLDSARLRAVREDRGIADAALRKAVGCPLSTWRALVAGRVPAERRVVEALCRTLGVSECEITAPPR